MTEYAVSLDGQKQYFQSAEKRGWYVAGWRASKAGKPRTANAHRPRSEAWHTWNDGYDDQKDHAREMKRKK